MPISAPLIVQKRQAPGPVLPSILDPYTFGMDAAATDPPKKNGQVKPNGDHAGPVDPTGTFPRIDTAAIPVPEAPGGTLRTIMQVLAGAGALGSLAAGPNSTFGAGASAVGQGAAMNLYGQDSQYAAEQEAYQKWLADAMEHNADVGAREAEMGAEWREKERVRVQEQLNKQNDPLRAEQIRKAKADADISQLRRDNPDKYLARAGASPKDSKAILSVVGELDQVHIPAAEKMLNDATTRLATINPDDDLMGWLTATQDAASARERIQELQDDRLDRIADVPTQEYAQYLAGRGAPPDSQTAQVVAKALRNQYGIGQAEGPTAQMVAPQIADEIDRMVQSGQLSQIAALEALRLLGL